MNEYIWGGGVRAEKKILIEIRTVGYLSKLKGLFADRGTDENGIKMSRTWKYTRDF